MDEETQRKQREYAEMERQRELMRRAQNESVGVGNYALLGGIGPERRETFRDQLQLIVELLPALRAQGVTRLMFGGVVVEMGAQER